MMGSVATGIEARFKDVVAVEADVAADGSIADDEGQVSPSWQPVQGLGSVPCLIYEYQPRRAPGQEMTEDLTMAVILFGITPTLPRNQRLRFRAVDVSGDTVYYHAEGKVNSPAGAYQRVMARLGAIG